LHIRAGRMDKNILWPGLSNPPTCWAGKICYNIPYYD
jgi:hypothetical protein